MQFSIGWTNSLVSKKAYIFQEYWDEEWLGAADIWERKGPLGEMILYLENYDMEKYGRQCEKDPEPEPRCYPWYDDMMDADGWIWSNFASDWFIHRVNWTDEWLGTYLDPIMKQLCETRDRGNR